MKKFLDEFEEKISEFRKNLSDLENAVQVKTEELPVVEKKLRKVEIDDNGEEWYSL